MKSKTNIAIFPCSFLYEYLNFKLKIDTNNILSLIKINYIKFHNILILCPLISNRYYKNNKDFE